MDCGFSIVRDGEQHAFHASRRAPQEPTDLEVGPFRIEIVEPMRRLRVVLDDNETGIACDLTLTPRTANVRGGAADRHSRPPASSWTPPASTSSAAGQGEIRYAGAARCAIDPARVVGTKDRSWGVRPVGMPDPGPAPRRTSCRSSSSCGRRSTGRTAARTRGRLRGCRRPHVALGRRRSCRPTIASRTSPALEDPGTRHLARVEHRLEYVAGHAAGRRGRAGAGRADGEQRVDVVRSSRCSASA